MMPRRSAGSSLPSMVNDLPVPVCPYAKIVPAGNMMECRKFARWQADFSGSLQCPNQVKARHYRRKLRLLLLLQLFLLTLWWLCRLLRTIVTIHTGIDNRTCCSFKNCCLLAVPVIHLSHQQPMQLNNYYSVSLPSTGS